MTVLVVCFAYRWWFCRAFWFCCLVKTTNKKMRVLVVCFAYSWLFCKVFWFCYLVNTTNKSVWCNRLCSCFLPPPPFFPKFGRLWLGRIIESWSCLVVDDKWVMNVFRVWQVSCQFELVCVCVFFFFIFLLFHTLLLEKLLCCRYCIYSPIIGDKVPNFTKLIFNLSQRKIMYFFNN